MMAALGWGKQHRFQLEQNPSDLRDSPFFQSEEYQLKEKRLVGNFPPAFSHVGLVNTVINIFTDRGPAHEPSRSQSSFCRLIEEFSSYISAQHLHVLELFQRHGKNVAIDNDKIRQLARF
jgi:hypothetical protein